MLNNSDIPNEYEIAYIFITRVNVLNYNTLLHMLFTLQVTAFMLSCNFYSPP
jgi:hypothetical protein